jgi:hypothetical protein
VTAARPQVFGTDQGYRDELPEPGDMLTLDISPIVRFFPHGKTRTGSTPRIENLRVRARTGPEPFKEIEDEVVDVVGHGTRPNHCTSVPS